MAKKKKKSEELVNPEGETAKAVFQGVHVRAVIYSEPHPVDGYALSESGERQPIGRELAHELVGKLKRGEVQAEVVESGVAETLKDFEGSVTHGVGFKVFKFA